MDNQTIEWNESATWACVGEVVRERKRQQELKVEGRFKNTPVDDIPPSRKLAMIAEELGEVARYALAAEGVVQEREDKVQLFKELSQVAALSVAWMESL